MTELRAGPYIWVTWLSRLLAGGFSCEWAAWFKARHKSYERMPSDFDMAQWQIAHTSLLNDVRDGLEREGRAVFVESQNYFTLRGSSGAVLGGKPDLVTVDEDGSGTIYDVKTGKQRASDAAQVMIYMYALPYIGQHRGRQLDGKLIYASGHEVDIPASAIDDSFRANLYGLIGRIVSDAPARRTPSALECRMCDLTPADCAERIDADPRDATAEGAGF